LQTIANLLRVSEVIHRDRIAAYFRDELSSINDIDQKTVALKAYVVKRVKRLLNSSYNFTYEQMVELEHKWGSLEPIFTLITRFHSNQDWRSELPVLSEVFGHS